MFQIVSILLTKYIAPSTRSIYSLKILWSLIRTYHRGMSVIIKTFSKCLRMQDHTINHYVNGEPKYLRHQMYLASSMTRPVSTLLTRWRAMEFSYPMVHSVILAILHNKTANTCSSGSKRSNNYIGRPNKIYLTSSLNDLLQYLSRLLYWHSKILSNRKPILIQKPTGIKRTTLASIPTGCSSKQLYKNAR